MYCLQGASAANRLLKEFAGKPVRVIVVWEPVLATDWLAPSTSTLKRIADPRAVQFWDKGRLLSHAMGERDKNSIVWDRINVYARGVVWNASPPQAVWEDGPVVDVIAAARNGIAGALAAP